MALQQIYWEQIATEDISSGIIEAALITYVRKRTLHVCIPVKITGTVSGSA